MGDSNSDIKIISTFADIHENKLWGPYILSNFKFFTIINLFLVILSKWTRKYVDLHLSCLIVAAAGFCISYIHPRKLDNFFYPGYMHRIEATSDSLYFYVVDFFLHWIPLIYVFIAYPLEPVGNKTVLTFFGIVFLIVAVNARDLYKTHLELAVIFAVSAAVIRLLLPARRV